MTGPNRLTAGIPDPATSSDVRTGTVTAVSARGITVAVSGGPVDASHLDSYAPAVGDTVALAKTQDSWLALGRVVGVNTAVDQQSPGTGVGPSVLAAMRTSGSATLLSTTGTAAPVPRYTLTYYHPPGHTVLVLVGFAWISTASADWLIADLTETVTGTAVGEITEPLVSSSFGRFASMASVAVDSLGGGRRTMTLTANRLTGTGTLSISANAARPGYMIVLDLGDKSVIVPT